TGDDPSPTPPAEEPSPTPTSEPEMMQRSMGIQSTDVTATVTKTVDDDTPFPGQEVTFRITIAGGAPAGTPLDLDDGYVSDRLNLVEDPLSDYLVESSTNLNMG